MRKEKLPPEAAKQGYHDYTSAALHTKARSSYGYYEVMAKPMNSGGSSSFWFRQETRPAGATEIDVFEIGGKAKGFEKKYNMTLHVCRTPKEKKHWQVGGAWIAPWRLADDYHVYGFDWGKDDLKFYVDGVRSVPSRTRTGTSRFYLIFDSETMPEWMGMPETRTCLRRSAWNMSGRGRRSSVGIRPRDTPWLVARHSDLQCGQISRPAGPLHVLPGGRRHRVHHDTVRHGARRLHDHCAPTAHRQAALRERNGRDATASVRLPIEDTCT